MTLGNPQKPVILFLHALGVNGKSNLFVADYLKDDYFIVIPTYSIFCPNSVYKGKQEEIDIIETYLESQGVLNIELIVASSIGADIAITFLKRTKQPVRHIFFDGGQFAKIPTKMRQLIMTPLLYVAMKSIYQSKGKTLKKIMWCDDDNIKPVFIEACKNLDYKSMKNMMKTSLTEEPYPAFDRNMQEKMIFEFGEIEDHFKYRDAVKESYPYSKFPIFPHKNHMEFQIREPEKFADMLQSVMKTGDMPKDLEIVY